MAAEKPALKKRSSSRCAKININTVGAAFISTFGAIFGIMGGIVCERGF